MFNLESSEVMERLIGILCVVMAGLICAMMYSGLPSAKGKHAINIYSLDRERDIYGQFALGSGRIDSQPCFTVYVQEEPNIYI